MIVFYTTLVSVDNVCNTSKLVCSDGFYYEDRTGIPGCRPECECGEWEEFPRGSVIAFDVFVVFQTIVCTISTIILVVLSAIHYKQMWVINHYSIQNNT